MDAQMIKTLQDYFATQPVLKAWVFGSFARGEETEDSDVDLLVQFDRSQKPVTLLTYARMWRGLRESLKREVDLVEDGTLKPYALQSADHDKIMVYERKN
ncbi:MAG: nucleotidyltransferase domain-containing protein [Bacteroidales bacterium]|nr:nucleotidyltransferase domain-containing protein [Bacteroidaceae bacterium]MDO4187299.1 nucleotidyltransferase domain-containing protein [Bacteroidales bacterium]